MKSPLEQSKPDYIDIDKDGNTTESMKEASMAKMKSPLEQTKFMDKVKSAGKGIVASLTAVDDFAQTGIAEYKRSKRKYRDADRKKKMKESSKK